ncbi:MAG: hypothetical protein COB09_07895 [Thalassobium sp.]|nr:MAG: hypothetical protein COB09_07895 [Thalassobium sp.]
MQLNEFPYFAPDLINLETAEDISGLQESQPVQLQTYGEGWLLQQGNQIIPVTSIKQDKPLLTSLVLRDQTRWLLAQVQANSHRLQLQYLAPADVQQLDLQLGVDGLISDDLFTKNEIRENSIEQACQWLHEHFVVTSAVATSNVSEEQHWLTITRFSNQATNNGFQLLGKGWRADVEQQKDGKYLIRRITRHRRRDSAFSLLMGDFSFADASATAAINSAVYQAQLQAALRDNGSYLELWNLYNDKEWEIALKRAETLKALRFTHAEHFEDGRINRWRIWPKASEAYKEFRERWNNLEIRDEQVDLSKQPPNWGEELQGDNSDESATSNVQQNARGEIRFEEDHVIFTPASNRPKDVPRFPAQKTEAGNSGTTQEAKGGWLYLSLAGQRTVGQRRLNARHSIDAGRRMPQLKALLEGVSVPAERRRSIKALTPYVKESFKGGKPTDKQLLALEAALNTPDIAIIIGPPGTGKTQVIAALQRRLAELFEDQAIAGQVLVSSFQRDALDNVLNRSLVLNLPPRRADGKNGNEDEEDSFSLWIEDQRHYLNKQVELQYEQAPALKTLDDINRTITLLRVSQYSADQYIEQLETLRQQTEALGERTPGSSPIRLPSRLLDELDEYIDQQRKIAPAKFTNPDNYALILKIRGLRTTATSYGDDGSQRAQDLLREIKRNLLTIDTDIIQLLEQAATSTSIGEQQLQLFIQAKNHLLDQFLPDYRPPLLKQALDTQGTELLNQLEYALEEHIRQHQQGVAWALQELASSIETDHQAALKTVEEYAMVVGATCQQAAGNQMASLKAIAGLEDNGIDFDTVIVDEAARANPLDLFIPMSMASRRIILVGDDRQLPHMLEPDIEGQLQEEHQLTEQQLLAFRSSLFERLRLKLQELQKQDGTQRVVMLDTQFRMHPVLGDFVSQQFYEAEGMEKVKSGRDAKDFTFDRKLITELGSSAEHYDRKVCQWLDVSATEGKAERRGTSRIRRAEAERIAQEIKRLFEAEQAANSSGQNSLSVGVITFYAAQRDLIMQKLTQTEVNGTPLMVKTPEGYQPHDTFKHAFKLKQDGTTSSEEGLRVGSVDAFQGKEFDVVFLSCVRTWQEPLKRQKHQRSNQSDNDTNSGDANTHETQLNRLFGFLRLPNRMNVAMSRQRQMLICVGDAQLATNEFAEEGIPALNAFYQLCGGEHGCIR